ncbi:MAG: GNAT family N-acetyltransferase [Alphaproteobacteria bacterium]|nr:MAG: GNAT family N-acetyltransferase [Alphaproteobacteria bacterium]
MYFKRYDATQAETWNAFVAQAKNGLFMFNRKFMDYHSDRFTDHSLMAYDDTGALIALLPANQRDGTLYSHQGLTFGGFVTGTKLKAANMLELMHLLQAYLQQNGLSKAIYKTIPHIYHAHPAQEDVYALFRTGAQIIRVDITTTVNLSDPLPFSELRRRGSKKAAKQGVTVQQSHNFAGFISMLAGVLAERHDTKPVHSLAEIELLASRFPDNIKLFTAEAAGEILAGTLIFEYPHMAHAQYIAASPAGREIGALDALFDTLIRNTYAHKAYFDFGISTEEAGTVLNEGLIHQKEGFGGRAVTHHVYELPAAR